MTTLNTPIANTNIAGNMTINMQLVSSGQAGATVYQRQSGAGFGNNTSQIFEVSGATLVTADYLPLTSTPTVLTVPNTTSPPVNITGTMLTGDIATYFCTNALLAGQFVTVVNSSNGSTFNVSAQPILRATPTYFTVAVTHADILYAAETSASATVAGGISMLYVENLSADQGVSVSWTPLGSSNETVVTLGPGGVIAMSFPGSDSSLPGSPLPGFPAGNGGISGVKLSAIASASSIPAQIINDQITSNVATYFTSAPHGFSVGQLVTTTGLSNASGAFNVTSQPILSVGEAFGISGTTTFTVGLVHANVAAAADAGDAVAIVAGDPAASYAILG
jgi:hypothetical protein